MSWFVVGGIAIGATAGAIVGSKKGGDDVWKDALIGGAIGGTAGYGAGALGAAEAAAPAAVAGEGGAGILGAGEVAGSGLALGGAGLETGGAMAGGAGIMGAEGAATLPAGGFAATATPTAYGSTAPLGSSVVPSAYNPLGTGVGGSSASYVPATGNTLQAAFAPGMQAPVQMVAAPEAASSELAQVTASPQGDIVNGVQTAANKTGYNPATDMATKSPLEKGFGSAMSWLSEPKNAMLTGVLGLGALSMFNNNNEDSFGGSNVQAAGYPLSPNFKPSRYQPTRTYAIGGIADAGSQNKMYPQSQIPDRMQFSTPSQMPTSQEVVNADYDTRVNPYTGEMPRFKTGGSASDRSDKAFAEARRYQGMIDPRMNVQTPDTPDWVRSRGVYNDDDPDTKYQDALTAAQTRMGKAASRANVQLGAMQKPTPMGKLSLGPVVNNEKQKADAGEDNVLAGGGIASLGGYAHGGNARLLRGPGDGMSDDIPATIAGKQPARLADGEFVVPADVVSGLGNGSTEAGAKKLHQMMDKVRVDRTGTKKQGKQIKAEKYVPKLASGGIARFDEGGEASAPLTRADLDAAIKQYTQAQSAPASGTPSAVGYDPNYYNPQYYQSQLPGAQQAVASAQQALAAQQGVRGFDANWYLSQNPDVAASSFGASPEKAFEHFQRYGVNEYGNPNTNRTAYEGWTPGTALADPAALAAAQKQAVAAQGTLNTVQSNVDRLANSTIKYNPYTVANRPSAAEPQFYGNIYKPEYQDMSAPDYMLAGNLGRWSNVSELNPTQYLQNNRDVARDATYGTNPFQHYLDYGMKEGRPREFDAAAYLQQNPDVAASAAYGQNPFQHYMDWGRKEGRSPTGPSGVDVMSGIQSTPAVGFNVQEYLAANPDVRADKFYGTNPFQHYIDYGMQEGRKGFEQSPQAFNASNYLAQNPDVAKNEVYGNNPYQHYLDYGKKEGRKPYKSGGITSIKKRKA